MPFSAFLKKKNISWSRVKSMLILFRLSYYDLHSAYKSLLRAMLCFLKLVGQQHMQIKSNSFLCVCVIRSPSTHGHEGQRFKLLSSNNIAQTTTQEVPGQKMLLVHLLLLFLSCRAPHASRKRCLTSSSMKQMFSYTLK